jgi:rubrerythrin
MAKQLARPLTDQERNVLMRLLADTGESISEIKERAMRVIRRYTYGNIALEHWMIEDDGPKVKGDCRYCGSEWWGTAEQKCPVCYPKKTADADLDDLV